MRIPQSYIQKCKVVAHVFQILFSFVAGCITISVFTKGTTGGASKFFFALVCEYYRTSLKELEVEVRLGHSG